MSSVSASAVVGAYGRFDAAASRMVKASTTGGTDDFAGAVVGLDEAKTGVRAAPAVTRTADEMTGILLDMIA